MSYNLEKEVLEILLSNIFRDIFCGSDIDINIAVED